MLITRADRTLVSKQIEAEVRNYFGHFVYERVVPASVKFREAYARGVPLIHYDRLSAGAMAYRAAAEAYLAGRAELPVPDLESAEAEDVSLDEEGAYLREAS